MKSSEKQFQTKISCYHSAFLFAKNSLVLPFHISLTKHIFMYLITKKKYSSIYLSNFVTQNLFYWYNLLTFCVVQLKYFLEHLLKNFCSRYSSNLIVYVYFYRRSINNARELYFKPMCIDIIFLRYNRKISSHLSRCRHKTTFWSNWFSL